MGNWRRVHLVGTCDLADSIFLRRYIDVSSVLCGDLGELDRAGPLSYCNSIMGLPCWPNTTINAFGNLFERDYSVEDVADNLGKLLELAPSLNLRVHVGDEHEQDGCVATLHAYAGEVRMLDPEVESIPEMTQADIERAIVRSLGRRR